MHPRTVDIRLMCFQYPCTWPRECLARRCHLEYRRVPVKPVIKPVIRSYSTWVFQRFAFRHEGQRQGQGQGEEYISRERPYSSKSVRLSVAGPLPGFCWVIWCCWWCGTTSRRRWGIKKHEQSCKTQRRVSAVCVSLSQNVLTEVYVNGERCSHWKIMNQIMNIDAV